METSVDKAQIPGTIWLSHILAILGAISSYPAATIHPFVAAKSTSSLPQELWFPSLLLATFGGFSAALLSALALRKIDREQRRWGGKKYAWTGIGLAAMSYIVPTTLILIGVIKKC